jgi:hypothetical protein
MSKPEYQEINVRLKAHINQHYPGKFWAALFWDEKTWLYMSSNITKQEVKVFVEYTDDWNFLVSECRKFFKIISNAKFKNSVIINENA